MCPKGVPWLGPSPAPLVRAWGLPSCTSHQPLPFTSCCCSQPESVIPLAWAVSECALPARHTVCVTPASFGPLCLTRESPGELESPPGSVSGNAGLHGQLWQREKEPGACRCSFKGRRSQPDVSSRSPGARAWQ
ncbi:hypothetical protein KIL84_015255 [Mauremys mutica]|uniref:Uncharacterized protein n=1 Tax=Mauremys mutica TaxID=74926 RepID=A0A9D3WSZ4_9SAUR|nr:hypothetical protein KIL84_015255 [Mauremys mutica]